MMFSEGVMNVPNGLSVMRLLIAPVLLVCAVMGLQQAFVVLLAVSLLTDILDGKLARWLGQTSSLGAKLDSWADFATYMSVPVCAYYLRPEVLTDLAPAFWIIVAAYVVPVAVGALKFRVLTSYHTRGAVVSAYLLGASSLVFFARGPSWPLWIAAAVLAVAELEEVAITLTLRSPHSNVKTWGHALRLRDQLGLRSEVRCGSRDYEERTSG